MSIALPKLPLTATATPRRVKAGGPSQGLLGVSTQMMQRLGDRWAVEVQLPLADRAVAEAYFAPILQADAEDDTLVLEMPQPADITPIGALLVNGAGQTGTSLICDGATPNVQIRALRFLSFIAGGRNYLHRITALATADGTGAITLNLWPALRVSPADDTALELIAPKIEGFIASPSDAELQMMEFYQLEAFTLAENR